MNLFFTKSSVAVVMHTASGIISLPVLIIYGNALSWMVCFLMYYCMTTLGSTVGYHRIATHKNADVSVIFKWICLFFGHIIVYGSVISWAAMHREHHKYHDTDKDPHSPVYKGWFYCHFLTPLRENKPRYVVDLLRDKGYRFQHEYYWYLLAAWVALLWYIDPFAILYAWLVPSFIAKICIGFSLSASHRDGKPHNDFILGLISGGECFHKNHHDDPRRIVWHSWDAGGHILNIMKKGSIG